MRRQQTGDAVSAVFLMLKHSLGRPVNDAQAHQLEVPEVWGEVRWAGRSGSVQRAGNTPGSTVEVTSRPGSDEKSEVRRGHHRAGKTGPALIPIKLLGIVLYGGLWPRGSVRRTVFDCAPRRQGQARRANVKAPVRSIRALADSSVMSSHIVLVQLLGASVI